MEPQLSAADLGEQLSTSERKFAEAIVAGKVSQATAYLDAGYKAKDTQAAGSKGNRLAKRGRVAEYIQAIHHEAAIISVREAVMQLGEAKEFLTDVIRTPVSKIDADSPLCHEVTAHGVKTIPKLPALQQLALMSGWNTPTEISVAARAPTMSRKELSRLMAKKPGKLDQALGTT